MGSKHAPGKGRLGPRRRLTQILAGAFVLVVVFVPLFIFVHSISEPCPAVLPEPSFWQRVNPLSQYNMCSKRGRSSSSETETTSTPELETAQPKDEPGKVSGGTVDPQALQEAEQQAAAAAQLALQQKQEQEARAEAERKAAAEKLRREEEEHNRQQEEHQKAEAEKKALEAHRKQEEEEEHKRQLDVQKKQEEQAVGQQQQTGEARPPRETAPVMDLQGVEMPRDKDDIERILRLPHYEQCNLCKVCIPLSVVADHPKAKNHPYVMNRRTVQTEDEDVKITVTTPTANTAATRRSRLLRSFRGVVDPQERAMYASNDMTSEDGHLGYGYGHGRGLLAGNDDTDEEVKKQEEELKKSQSNSDGIHRIKGADIDISDIAPGDTKAGPRAGLPNCTACWGCDHTLEMMAMGHVMAGSHYSHEPGGSPSWLFRVRSDRTKSGWAVVKLWCVPVRKVKQRGLSMCAPPRVYAQVKLLLAQQKVIHECGFNDFIPAVWVEPVHGVIPGHGFRIDWLGMWADIADGLSVQNIQEAGYPKSSPEFVLDLFTNRINHTAIKLAAIFDVMTSQCDRHQQNIFMNEHGKVWAIDNDQVSGTAWRTCAFDSLLLPTTQKFAINHLGFFYVMKHPDDNPPKTPANDLNPLLLLDYRCHTEKGVIGWNYPPALKTCLRHLSSLTATQIQQDYGYPTQRMAAVLRNRTVDLISRGFEWTLLHTQPHNMPQHRYKVPPKCCEMYYDSKKKMFFCKDPNFRQMEELPYGNPWHGGSWHGKKGVDPGSYVGGQAFV